MNPLLLIFLPYVCVSMFSRDLFTGIGKISSMHCGRFWQCDSYHYLVHKGKSKSKRVNWARLREMGYAISSTATNKNYVDICLQITSE